MPRKPIGDVAMSSTERVHRWRERHGLVGKTDRQKLIKARQELAELRQQLAAATHQQPVKAAPASSAKPAPLVDAERSKLEFQLHFWRHEAKVLRDEVTKLKAKIVKPVKPPPLDPESEAARQIDALKKINKSLRQKVDRLMPSAVKTKVAKALTEQTTDREKRLDALQAWNGLGLNNLGK
jgi:hypothetical protein